MPKAKVNRDPQATEKQCVDCWRLLPLDAFHRRLRTLDGHHCYCKECQRHRTTGGNADRLRLHPEQRVRKQRSDIRILSVRCADCNCEITRVSTLCWSCYVQARRNSGRKFIVNKRTRSMVTGGNLGAKTPLGDAPRLDRALAENLP